MNVLVTGATGFLGTNLVHELLKAGHSVRATGYPGSETKYIQVPGVEYEPADITDREAVIKLARDREVVYHVAGDTSFWKKNFARQRRINIEGTVNVAEACLAQGVKRMIHTSTLDVLGYSPEGAALTEETGKFNFNNIGYNYGESKLEAEIRFRAYLDKGLDGVIIYPGFMMGPYDFTLQIGRVFFDLKAGTIPGAPAGGGSVCHVTEVARAHIAAAEKGRRGEGYLCSGMDYTNVSYQELFKRMAWAADAKAPRLTLPRSVMVAYGYLSEFISEFTRKPPEMNPGMAHYMSSPQYSDSSKAIRELGYHVPPVEECIQSALDWYRSNGFTI